MWPFKRKQPDIQTLPPLTSDLYTWGVGQSEVDGSPLIVRYNETAKLWAGHTELSIRLGFAVPLNDPHEGGLPNPQENLQLNEVEDLIVENVAARTRALPALVLTTGIMKEFIFYIPRGVDIRSLHEAIQAAVVSHEVQCLAAQDPRWEVYRQFTPRS